MHEARAEEYERVWRYAADTYLGYPLYKKRVGGRSIPIMVMTPLSVRRAVYFKGLILVDILDTGGRV